MSLSSFLQHLVNALSLGGIYALIAIGYTMVYGILRLINFAHGDVFTYGIYFAFYGVSIFLMPWWISFMFSIFLTAFLGAFIEKVAYRPLRNAPRISALITAIGVSFFLENFAIVAFGGRAKSFNPQTGIYPNSFLRMLQIGKVRLPILTLITLGITAISLFILIWIVYRTKIGMAMRAISKDIPTTRLMGVNADRVISFTFMIGSGLAAIGGILWAMKYPQIYPFTGMIPGLKAFIAAVVGGIGSIQGAMIGGFILGISEIMIVAFIPSLAGYRDAFAYAILLFVLLVKPTGILGVEVSEKV
ncbi:MULTISPECIES: branched-chain amino acid ABC transporter permease [Pseudothermotoga]|uniref:Inner-membrane translocator n=1 Tax=Pseudothermotoga lettingae (strain ATCC BAA-301 / DSM 14385 / NBRC 107922 / TMO) TaxID=416591 RepID=A8F5D2_PSELT|nr:MULTISPECIES: branched-chain amino acid ABC transporter permease [Pseudothermotoga]ABV33366.1 inner-membrane translocator [Pseudothermotoga lettingae TMO]KUK20212.1 MAG: Inner-membrane translocator [Pseudothermotoga lettingae]MDI3495123.1 branched-chain amino acid transport system permease protein [Pseudothermotoga sp.]MDK2884464.1 branched-chain amino acid transport system permease protein [Pseudothermotoga sp.]GLI49719.1 branched-chain amino acid ABC transporter permease [Pseudothermotoga